MRHTPSKPAWRRWLQPETYSFQPKTPALRFAKRIAITVIGSTVVLIGVVMIVTPGPAILVIPAGLGILAIEFAWARRWLRRIKAYTRIASRRARRKSKTQGHDRH